MQHYSIQPAKGKAETVTQTQLDAMKQQMGSRFSSFYTVKEVKGPTAPKDLETTPVGTKKAPSDKPE